MPTIESTSSSAASAASTLVPTFPLAPTTATRMRIAYPRGLPGKRRAAVRRTALAALASGIVRRRLGLADDVGAELVQEPGHLLAGVGLHALRVAAGGACLTALVGPAHLDSRPLRQRLGDRVARANLGPLRGQLLQRLGDVDDVALVVAAQELVPDEMAARPSGVAVGADDLRLADGPDRVAVVRHVVDAHVDAAGVPGLVLERVDVSAAAAGVAARSGCPGAARAAATGARAGRRRSEHADRDRRHGSRRGDPRLFAHGSQASLLRRPTGLAVGLALKKQRSH